MKWTARLFCMIAPLLLSSHISLAAQPAPDFQVNENASMDGSEQSNPSIGGDGQGNLVVTWMDERNGIGFDIFAQIYSSDGSPVGTNFKVSQEGGYASQYRPAVAVDPDLNSVITWIDKRSGDWNIYAQRFSSEGVELGDNFRVNDDLGSEEQEHPSISIDGSGNFVVVWADERNGDWDVYAQRYTSDGSTIGSNFKINDDGGDTVQYWPSSAGDEEGNIIVTWADQRYGDYDIFVQRFSADGTALGNNVRVNTDQGDAMQLVSSAAIDGDGEYVVAWSDERSGDWDVFAQRYASDGQPVGVNFKINEATPSAYHTSPSLSTDLIGNFVVSWDDGRNGTCDIYAQRYSAEGVPVGTNFMVNDSTGVFYQTSSKINVNDNGTFTITWGDHRLGFLGDVFAQSYSSDGTEVRDNFKVNDDEGSENQVDPSIAQDGDENFVIAWTDSRENGEDVYAQRFSSDGTELGTDFRVNDDTGGAIQWDSSVAADAEGNFVIAWGDYRGRHCDPSNIYAQRYSHDGTALGSNFRVNNIGAAMHYGPAAACKRGGGFIIAWGDAEDGAKGEGQLPGISDRSASESERMSDSRGTEPDIYAQQYSGDGTPVGGNFRVNDDAGTTYQESPAIAVDADDSFVITWQDNRSGEWDIYFQRYSGDGTALGINQRVEGCPPGSDQRGAAVSADGSGAFVIAWRDNRNGDQDVYAQCFDSGGGAVGENFRVNSDSETTHQSAPFVSANSAGDFVITWSERRDGDNDVFAQRYLSGAVPFGENYRISDTDALEQIGPAVVLGESKIRTTWRDNRGGQSGHDIWANVMDWDFTAGIGDGFPSSTLLMPCLSQNSPNPFNPTTTIQYRIPERGHVILEVFSIQGRRVAALVDEIKEPGTYQAIYETADLSSGTYFYRLRSGHSVDVRRMVLLK